MVVTQGPVLMRSVSWGKIRANAKHVKVFDFKNYFSCQGYITIINVRNLDIHLSVPDLLNN